LVTSGLAAAGTSSISAALADASGVPADGEMSPAGPRAGALAKMPGASDL